MVSYIVKEGDPDATLFTREAMQLEAYCSAVGKLLLAQLSDERLSEYLATAPFVALTPYTITEPDEIRRHLVEIRSAGFAVDDREVADDLVCIAVPVRLASDEVVAAISCSRRSPWEASPPLVKSMRQAAEEIADGL